MIKWKRELLFTSAIAKYDYNDNNYIKKDQQIWMYSCLADRTFKKSMKYEKKYEKKLLGGICVFDICLIWVNISFHKLKSIL